VINVDRGVESSEIENVKNVHPVALISLSSLFVSSLSILLIRSLEVPQDNKKLIRAKGVICRLEHRHDVVHYHILLSAAGASPILTRSHH